MPEGKVWQAQRKRARLPRIFFDWKGRFFLGTKPGGKLRNHPCVWKRAEIASSVARRARSAT